MNSRLPVYLAVLFFIVAVALGIIAVMESNNRRDDQQAFATERANSAVNAFAEISALGTASAGEQNALATAAASDIEGVRSAAATLQAGAMATRSGLRQQLDDVQREATLNAGAQSTAIAESEATRTGLEETATAQAEALEAAQEAAAGLEVQLTADAGLVATQNAQIAQLQTEIESLQSQAAQSPATTAVPAAAATPGQPSGEQPVAAVAVGELLFFDTFGEDSATSGQEYEGTGRTERVDDQFAVIIDENPAMGITTLTEINIADAYVEVEFTAEVCPADTLLLLELRTNPEAGTGYAIGLDCALANWGVFRRTDGRAELLEVSELTGFTPSTTAAQVLGAEANGSSIRLYLNGTLIGGVSDPAYQEGLFGFSVIATSTARILWDNIRIWSLSEESSAAPVPEPTVTGYDSRQARDAFLNSLPESFAAGERTWRIASAPQLDVSDVDISTVSMLLEDEEGIQSILSVIFGASPNDLETVANDAATALGIQTFDQQRENFPEVSIFGSSAQGLEAIWLEGNALVRVTVIDTERGTEEILRELATAIRQLIQAAS